MRPRAAKVWNDRETVREEKEGAKEEGEEEAEQEKKEMREREVRENRRSERIEQEAIRECLMPRTKLCNYLHVRLKTILTSANACSSARVCEMLCAYLCPCVAPAQVIRRQAVRMYVYV